MASIYEIEKIREIQEKTSYIADLSTEEVRDFLLKGVAPTFPTKPTLR